MSTRALPADGTYRPTCPKCGGRVAEANTVFVWTPVTILVSDTGRRVEATAAADIVWDELKYEDIEYPYQCRSCLARFVDVDDATWEAAP